MTSLPHLVPLVVSQKITSHLPRLLTITSEYKKMFPHDSWWNTEVQTHVQLIYWDVNYWSVCKWLVGIHIASDVKIGNPLQDLPFLLEIPESAFLLLVFPDLELRLFRFRGKRQRNIPSPHGRAYAWRKKAWNPQSFWSKFKSLIQSFIHLIDSFTLCAAVKGKTLFLIDSFTGTPPGERYRHTSRDC